MAGIYIHIPFCRSRCIYCDFYSTTSLELRQRYVEALCLEIENRPFPLPEGMGIDTIYIGGGTPSQLTIGQLEQLFIYINKVYSLPSIQGEAGDRAEITIEVNPDDVTIEYAAMLSKLPINRVSMGIQTFDDQRLRFLHRRHTASQAITAVKTLRDAGFRNISIDLMYGFPGETLSDWEADIDTALTLNAEHLSAYCLMIEDGTPLHQMIIKKAAIKREQSSLLELPSVSRLDEVNLEFREAFPSEELERQMYYKLINRLEAGGYEHYEISNFAKIPPTGRVRGGDSSFRSRHNSGYWNGTPYIGLGAAAHSYDGRSRSWNVADINAYIEGMEQGKRIFEEELLDEDTRYNDTITVALRTKEGLNLSLLAKKYQDYCMKNARRYLDDGLLELSVVEDYNTPTLHLTRRGLFVSDMVMSDLMMV